MWFSITTGGELSTIWFNIFSGPATPVFSLEHYGVEKRCLVQGGDYGEGCAAIPDELEDSVCAHAKGGGPTSESPTCRGDPAEDYRAPCLSMSRHAFSQRRHSSAQRRIMSSLLNRSQAS